MELSFQIINAKIGDVAHFACGGLATIESADVYDHGSGASYYFAFHDGVRMGYDKNGKGVSYPARILDIVKITKKGEGIEPPEIANILAVKEREIADLKDLVRGIAKNALKAVGDNPMTPKPPTAPHNGLLPCPFFKEGKVKHRQSQYGHYITVIKPDSKYGDDEYYRLAYYSTAEDAISAWNTRNDDGVPWENYASYLLDKYEGEVITEDFLQMALGRMMLDSKYNTRAPDHKEPDAQDKRTFNILSERKPLSANRSDTKYEVLYKGNIIAKPNYAFWDKDEQKFCVDWEGYLDKKPEHIKWRLYQEPSTARRYAAQPVPSEQAGEALEKIRKDVEFYTAMADRSYADKDGKIDRTDFASILKEVLRRFEGNISALSTPAQQVPADVVRELQALKKRGHKPREEFDEDLALNDIHNAAIDACIAALQNRVGD